MKKIIDYLNNDLTRKKIAGLIAENLLYYQAINTDEKIQSLRGLMYNQFVAECVQSNQYMSLSNSTIERINAIYETLITRLRKICLYKQELTAIEEIVTEHRRNLVDALEENSGITLSERIIIPCAEYSLSFQKKILGLYEKKLCEPIIDIGCGKDQTLVDGLLHQGYACVFGMDQYVGTMPHVICSNWFDFHFCSHTWGTVIAHMSFSNHFRRTITTQDEDREKYMKKYNEILCSLKEGGEFIYTPTVPEAEDTIRKDLYRVDYCRNSGDRDLDTVCIKKKHHLCGRTSV